MRHKLILSSMEQKNDTAVCKTIRISVKWRSATDNMLTLKVAAYQSTIAIRFCGYQSLGRNACPSTIIVIGMCDMKNARKAMRVVPWMLFIVHDVVVVRSYWLPGLVSFSLYLYLSRAHRCSSFMENGEWRDEAGAR